MGSRWRAALAAAAVAASGLLAAVPAGASGAAQIGASQIVVATPGARAVIDRSPFRLTFEDRTGRVVLREAPAPAVDTAVQPPVPQLQAGASSPPAPALYAPLAFTVGARRDAQVPAGQYEGNLVTGAEGGVQYAARSVLAAAPDGDGVVLTLSTSDPSGRTLRVTVSPAPGDTLRVSARPSDPTGVAVMSDAFASPAGEAFHGFGGRHNALDQHGNQFLNWLQQENTSAGSLSPVVDPVPFGAGDRTLFPNGPEAAYYVQSSFISSGGYGFLLDRSEISDWRMDSDTPGAWRTAVAAPAIDYVVAPGDGPAAVAALTAITGRQRVPPAWAAGTILDREVRYPSDPPAQYEGEVEGDLRDIARYHLPLDAYRIEGWQFLPRDVLAGYIARLRKMAVHPMVYFRSFVGQDAIGTDDPAAYDEAVAKGYVATTADGRPYTFVSNFNAQAAQIDFTNPAAVRWYEGRIRAALDLGADGFMADFGEQVQADMHFADGSTGASMHNRLPVLYQRTVREAVDAYERDHPGRRIFFFDRAGYTGSPGSAAFEGASFPGDETTDFSRSAGLASQTTDMLNRAVGGAYGFTTDIGGYFDVGPYSPTTKELFLRWAEWAALSPMFRLHGSLAAGTHTPWSFDAETVRVYNALSELHDRARSLVLALWGDALRTGMPITRPLWLAYPGDARAAAQDQEWLLGADVLVAPVVEQGATSRSVYFPAGCWQRPDTAERYAGGASATVGARLDQLPYFFRCGTSPFAAAAARVGGGSGAAPRACASRRRITVHLRRPQLRRVRVYVGGRRVRGVRVVGRSVVIDLRGRARGTLSVRITGVTSTGRRVTVRRTYRTCTRRVAAPRARPRFTG